MDPTASQRFAAFASALEIDAAPADVREAVGLHLLDALGCGLAAVGTGAAPYAAALDGAGEVGSSSGLGVPAPMPAAWAALANGIRCHALDFDDTHPASIAHVSAVVVPAALAAAEAAAATGAALAAALLAGNEITCRVGRPAGDAFHLRGFHPTAICGAFGATAAVAKLRGLDDRATTNALGIVGSMAAGLMAYLTDGSDTKRVHPGWMAHAAHAAVALAAGGATGPAAVLEGRSGVYEAFIERDHVDVDALAGDLGATWETTEIAFKPYPACHFVHAPLDALADLAEAHGFEAAAVERVTVFSPQAGIDLICDPPERKRRPATAYEAKFSAPFAVAALLQTGQVDATTFGEPLLSDAGIHAIADKVDYETRDYDTFPASLPGGVRVTLANGEHHERHLLHQRGGARNRMTAADVRAKYRRNAEVALAPAAADTLERAVLELARLRDVSAFAVLRDARVDRRYDGS